jgi:hypothetical protein
MEKYKTTINALFYLSVCLFVATGSIFVINSKKNAYATGSTGGRIVSANLNIAPACAFSPCSCALPPTHYQVIISPAGGSPDPMLCIPYVAVPNFGVPVTTASIGYQIIGFWTVTQPSAVSANWGSAP